MTPEFDWIAALWIEKAGKSHARGRTPSHGVPTDRIYRGQSRARQ